MESLFKSAAENSEKEGRYDSESIEGFGEARILVVGSGGAGNNTLTRLSSLQIHGAELIAVNTDKQQLEHTIADKKILMGYEITKGLGAGGFPEVGEKAAVQAKAVLREAMGDADLVFVVLDDFHQPLLAIVLYNRFQRTFCRPDLVYEFCVAVQRHGPYLNGLAVNVYRLSVRHNVSSKE